MPIRELRLSNGAEFVVVVTGDIMTMPGLPRVPSAEKIHSMTKARSKVCSKPSLRLLLKELGRSDPFWAAYSFWRRPFSALLARFPPLGTVFDAYPFLSSGKSLSDSQTAKPRCPFGRLSRRKLAASLKGAVRNGKCPSGKWCALWCS